jgi:D-3-phosphoglycerate dehydrogenase
MTHKILSTSPSFGYFASEPLDYLKSHNCEWELLPQGKKISQEELTDRIKGVDAIVVGMEEKITGAVLDAATKLKIITKHGAGVDNIDIPAATKKGIPVVSAAGANSDAVADLTLGLFLSGTDHPLRRPLRPRGKMAAHRGASIERKGLRNYRVGPDREESG